MQINQSEVYCRLYNLLEKKTKTKAKTEKKQKK